jgi:hypothetical protein
MPETLQSTTLGLRKRAMPYQMAAYSIRYKNASIQKTVCMLKFKTGSLAFWVVHTDSRHQVLALPVHDTQDYAFWE